MSLLDDVSLMITPNGVAEDVLFGVLPEPIIGTELITNGDFATAGTPTTSSYSLGWNLASASNVGSNIVGGELVLTSDSSSSVYPRVYATNGVNSINILTIGKTYKFTYTVSEVSNSPNLAYFNGYSYVDINATLGTHTYYYTQLSPNQIFVLNNDRNATSVIKLSNVSVREYTSADMDFTRATTATFVNYAELITSSASGFPRLDTPSGGGCPHILVEPQRINIALRSEEIDNATWSKTTGGTASAPVVTVNNVVSPDGTQNADKVVFDLNGGTSGSDFSLLSQTYTQTADTYSLSCYLKGESGGEKIFMDFDNQNSNIVTLTTDWVRYTFSKAVTNTGSRTIKFGTSGGVATDDNPSVYMWGCQLEVSSYATSYIPTAGSTVTRNKDLFVRTGIGDLIGTEGVLYLEMASAGSGSQESISLSDGTTGNRVMIYFTAGGQIRGLSGVGGVQTNPVVYASATETDFNKIALRYKDDELTLFVNGSERDKESGTFSISTDLTDLRFSSGGTGAYFYGKIRQLQLYKTALTDAQCDALTT
tara:strand:+ start:2218 stop:3831 length:1614 start_codon:yes stop_codon:yes gene_type:complete